MCNKTIIFMNIWEEINKNDSILESVIGDKVTKRNKKTANRLISWLGTTAGQAFIEKVNEIENTEHRAERQI